MAEEVSSTSQKHFFVTRKRLSRQDAVQSSHNIFLEQPVEEQGMQPPSSLYHILGDREFKEKHLMEQTLNRRTSSDVAANAKKHTNTTGHMQMMDTTGRLTIRNQSHLLQLSELNYLQRDEKTFEHFANVPQTVTKMTDTWNKFDGKMKKVLRRRREQPTPPKIRLFAHDNPESAEIIKQIGLQYWQMSLRNNNKQLLKHLDAVPVQRDDFLRHMQTVKGKQLLQSSVPKINRRISEGFSLDGKRRTTSNRESTFSMIPSETSMRPQEVLRCNWQNKNLSRVYQQYAT